MSDNPIPALPPEVRAGLPILELPKRPQLVQAFDAAWAMALREGLQDAPGGGGKIVGSSFSPTLFQWDSAMLPLWLRYATAPLPQAGNGMAAVDLFYAQQREDGALPLAVREDGSPVFQDSPDGLPAIAGSDWDHPAAVLPPAPFAWAEWEYYSVTGDDSRLRRVLTILAAHFDWQASAWTRKQGYFHWQPPGGRVHPHHDGTWAWADYTAQAAVECAALSNIALYVDDKAIGEGCAANFLGLKELANDKLWDELRNGYVDVDEDDLWLGAIHAGEFWALLADIAPPDRASEMVRQLITYRQFARPHPVPTMAASEKWYSPKGARWRGGVWQPLSYVAATALGLRKQYRLAGELALRHAEAVAATLARTGSFWDCYAPDAADMPGQTAEPGFAGWCGLAPVALVIEQVLGLRVEGGLGSVEWRPRLEEEQGIANLRVGPDAIVHLSTRLVKNQWHCTVRSTGPVEVQIHGFQGSKRVNLTKAGETSIVV